VHEAQVYYVVISNIRFQTAKKWYRCLFVTSYWRLKDNVGRRCCSIQCITSTKFQALSYITLDNQWFFSIWKLIRVQCKRIQGMSCMWRRHIFLQLKHSRKIIYLAFKRFLPLSHCYRRLRKANSSTEEGKALKTLTGEEVYQRTNHLRASYIKRKKITVEKNV